ncbi:MAG: hypothetical protein E7083_04370 [Bacteroidales bacterium]|nr:hypothetical protein [Bacteroidales bacterium]
MIKISNILIIVLLLLTSCSNDRDTKLEGRWQATTIESPQHFLETDSLFWSFDSGVCEIQTLRNFYPHYAEQIFANYLLNSDSIKISVPEKYINIAKRNRYLDWKTQERKFAIRELTSKSLKLSVNDTIYSFRKYY